MSTLYCTGYDFDGTTCRVHHNPTTTLTPSGGYSAGLSRGVVPLTTYVRNIGYSRSMGMTRGLPGSDPVYLGTSFDYLWTLGKPPRHEPRSHFVANSYRVAGTSGPIPTSVTTPASTYVPIDMSTNRDVSRVRNVFGLVSRLLLDVDGDDFGAAVGGPTTTTSIASSLTTGDAVCDDDVCGACTLYNRNVSVSPTLWHRWCGRPTTRLYEDAPTIVAGTGMSLEQSLSVLRKAVPMRLGFGTLPVRFASPPPRAPCRRHRFLTCLLAGIEPRVVQPVPVCCIVHWSSAIASVLLAVIDWSGWRSDVSWRVVCLRRAVLVGDGDANERVPSTDNDLAWMRCGLYSFDDGCNECGND